MAILLSKGGSAAALMPDGDGCVLPLLQPCVGLGLEVPTHCPGREWLITGRIICGELPV